MDDNKVAVLLEDLRGQFRVFGEGLQILNDKVDNLDKKVSGLEHKIDEHIMINHQEHMQLMQMIRETDSEL